jgi:ligand-binding SRPBCC domain-containing protein
MPVITLHTIIQASPETCFNLSRSVDLHLKSTAETGEQAVAGKTSGLMELNDTVTWRARHLGVKQDLTSKITEYEFPVRFVSEMQKGAFKKLHHQHIFIREGDRTRMTDVFYFEAPFGWIGKLVCNLFLTNYMKGFLERRNDLIKREAEHKSVG